MAITLASIVLATATASLLRQQQSASGFAAHASVVAQLRPAATAVAAQLAHVSPASGDLMAGAWRDTALQFRAPIASGISCDATAGAVTLATASAGDIPLGGILSPPRAGDSLWFYSDSVGRWVGRAIAGTVSATAACGDRAAGATLRLLLAGTDTILAGAAVRITRQIRLVIYRGGEMGWHLGLREWSDAAKELSPPQPIAGPFLASAASGVRTGFRYFDAAGNELHEYRDARATETVRRVRLTLVAARRDSRMAGAANAVQLDSVDVAFSAGHAP